MSRWSPTAAHAIGEKTASEMQGCSCVGIGWWWEAERGTCHMPQWRRWARSAMRQPMCPIAPRGILQLLNIECTHFRGPGRSWRIHAAGPTKADLQRAPKAHRVDRNEYQGWRINKGKQESEGGLELTGVLLVYKRKQVLPWLRLSVPVVFSQGLQHQAALLWYNTRSLFCT